MMLHSTPVSFKLTLGVGEFTKYQPIAFVEFLGGVVEIAIAQGHPGIKNNNKNTD